MEHDKYWLDECEEIVILDEPFDELVARSIAEMKGKWPEFKPFWRLNGDGGFIEVHWENVAENYHPCNEHIGFYRAIDDGRIVGVKLNNVIGNIPSLVEHQAWRFRHDKAFKRAVEEYKARRRDDAPKTD